MIDAHGPESDSPISTEKATSWHDWTSRVGSDGQEDPKATPWREAKPRRDADKGRVREAYA